MKEACDGSSDGLQRRFTAWRDRCGHKLDDFKNLHGNFGSTADRRSPSVTMRFDQEISA